MDTAISRLLKILALERKQGFRNKAVIGGLDKFVSRWEPDARAEAGNAQPISPATSHAINEIVALLLGYPAIEDTAARERILEQVARRAREIGGEPAPAPDEPGAVDGGRPKPASSPAESDRSAAAEPAPRPAEEAPGDRTWERPADLFAPARVKPASSTPEARPAAPRPEPYQAEPVRPQPPRPESPRQESRRVEPVRAEAARPEPRSAEPPAVASPRPRPAGPGEDETAELGDVPRPRINVRSGRPTGADAGSSPDSGIGADGNFGLDAPVTRLPGVGPGFAQKLAKMNVRTVRDLLYLLPHRYEDYSQLRTIDRLKWGEEITVIGTVWKLKSRTIGDDRKMITAVVGDGTGEMEMTWFNPYVEKQLRVGYAYAFSGKVDNYRGVPTMRPRNFEQLDRNQVSTGRLVPIYPLTEGLSAGWLRHIMSRAVETWANEMPDFLPDAVRGQAQVLPLAEALAQIHFPDSRELLAAAHRRLSFDEFLVLQLGVLAARQQFRGAAARPLPADEATLAQFIQSLPFAMTLAQRRTVEQIAADLGSAQPMSRLLQGDVGSGKTAVAATALWVAVADGAQGAIMAPTEILAEQHARSFGQMFEGLMHPTADRPVRVVMLTGSQRPAEREGALAALATGEADIAVGTHALIQQGVEFRNLALVVVDEQHRFGVEQRAALRQKGVQPHMLVMSATPIPRSLALTLYGDLDISVIDEMPAGRTPIKTKWLTANQRERAYDFVRRQVEIGRQAFIIYPLVEESTASDARAAVEEHARLQKSVFPDRRLGLLHGRLKGEEKDAVMRAFSAGELDILVATSVVEVGIDVPNASVIVIEGAERFGLAQLHQFRGRVGRGQYPSYCILIAGQMEDGALTGLQEAGMTRLQALEINNDGFALAQIDLNLRGPGDFFGTRQSGLPPLRTAQLSDLRTLELARAAAQQIFEADPELKRSEHRLLAAQVMVFWSGTGDVS